MDTYVLIGSVLAIAAIVSTKFAQRFGVPSLVLFVFIGMLAGSSGPGGIVFDDYELALNLGILALAVILLSGGLDTKAQSFRKALLPATLLATVGVIVKMLIIGGLSWFFTPLGWIEGLLLGAVLAPTDAAAVFAVLKGQGLPDRLRGVLETESGTNDPVSIYLTTALVGVLVTGEFSPVNLGVGVLAQLILGGLLGYAGGRLLVWLLNVVRIDTFGLYPVLVLAGGLLIYSGANLIGGNGFLAIYILGVVVGNYRIPHKQTISYFMDGTAWGAQVSMFLMLGLLVFPNELLSHIPLALAVTFGLIVIARPLSVWVTLAPLQFTHAHRYSLREQLLLSWAGLKGAVPIILAIFPLVADVQSGSLIFSIVFVSVIVGATLQGLTIVPLARFLGLAFDEPPQPPVRLELGGDAPPGSAVFDVYLQPEAPVVGKTLAEIQLHEDLVIAAIHRGDHIVAPRGKVRLRAGDHIYFISGRAESADIPPDFRAGGADTPQAQTEALEQT